MKIRVSRADLLAALQTAAAVVPSKPAKPVLACVKLVAEGDSLTVRATDMEIGVSHEFAGVEVVRAGKVLIQPGKLIGILRESSDVAVSLSGDDNGSEVRTSSGRFQLPGGPVAEFPDFTTVDEPDAEFDVEGHHLGRAIKRTAFAADKTDATARWAVTGVKFEVGDGTARLVATDTRRLAVADVPATVHTRPPGDPRYLVPQRAVQLVERSMAEGVMVTVRLARSGAAFEAGATVVHTRLVEGTFPPYRDILPKTFDHRVPLGNAADKPPFLSAVRQAAIMADFESKRVEFTFDGGRVAMKAQGGADVGSGEVVFELFGHQVSPAVEVSLNPQYLIDMLRVTEGDGSGLVLNINDGHKPVVFHVGQEYQYLVMPLTG